MAETSLPDYSTVWASGGDKLQPTNSKIALGWEVEIPPRQWFNWLDNKQDQAIQHIIQHGIPQWSSTIEYQAGKSFVQGTDGLIYKAIITNTNISPVSDTAGNWSQVSLTPRGIQRFTSGGTFKVPYGVTTLYISGCAGGSGGAGGGGAVNTLGTGAGGAGGSAGQSTIRQPVTVTPGQSIAVSIGSAGAGGSAGFPGTNGGNSGKGGDTTFGSLVSLVGGSLSMGGASFSSGVPAGGIPGAGFPTGSCGGDGANGVNLGVGCGGPGASSPFGGGGGSGRSGSTGVGGGAAYGYGSGGGGGGGGYGSSGAGANGGTGGQGAPGFLIVEW